jgi:sugar diacid utilization regulator
VASLHALLASPALSACLRVVARSGLDREVERVALIEDLDELERVEAGAIALLTPAGSAAAGTYRLDVALRLARSRGVPALVLSGGTPAELTPTAAVTAARWGIGILETVGDVDLAELSVAIARELSGGADVALVRAHAALRAVRAHPPGGQPEGLLERAGAALGVPLGLSDSEPADGPSAPLAIEDHVEGWVTGPRQSGDLALALDIVLSVAAAAVQDAAIRQRRGEELPIQTRSEALTELLAAPPQGRVALARRARSLGVPIDGWHVAVRLELEAVADDRDGDDPLKIDALQRSLSRAALQALRATGGSWHAARGGSALILLRIFRDDPGIAAAGRVAATMDETLVRVRPRMPSALVRCGVGSAHPGVNGLLSSVAEAKAAVTAARTLGRVNTAVPFDGAGLRRTLIEWYASDTAREAVTTLLAPLDRIGGTRGERLIQTLQVYLEHRGSATRTAEALNLHRNAVSYRINKIFELLEVDPDNPDDLLLLQLACRARGLA